MSGLSESAIIAILAGDPPHDPALLVPNGDDAAAWLPVPGLAQVATVDAQVEGVHFDFRWAPPACVGRKLVAVNASDLSAMGATPRFALLSAELPPAVERDALVSFAAGLHARLGEVGAILVGGNVTRGAERWSLHLTLIGEAPAERLLRQGAARAGDRLFVTGTLGDARAGLERAQRGEGGPLVEALIDPSPPLAAGPALARTGLVRSMCDVSDGLGRDVRRLLAGTGCGARIDQVPVSAALAAAVMDPVAYALGGGEDYQLLFTVAPECAEVFAAQDHGVRLTAIGVVTAEPLFSYADASGTRDLPGGFEHFAVPTKRS